MKTKLSFQAAECNFDDVIFSNRNQAYGAYYLRKKYNKHLMLALLLVTFLFVSGVSMPLIYKKLFPPVPEEKKVPTTGPVIIIEIDKDRFKIPEFKPPDIDKATAGVVSQNTSGALRPVDTLLQTPNTTVIPLANDNSGDTTGISGPIIIVDNTSSIIPPPETIYTFVEEPATFNGGSLESFRDWFMKNYTYPQTALDNRIDGKINLNFVIGKNGELTDVNILRSPHSSLKDEALKVLMNSPQWQAAKQNGKVVKQRFSMQIKLEIQ